MGAPGAVAILSGRELAAIGDGEERAVVRASLEEAYTRRYCTPDIAAERGYVDDVIDPAHTRRAVARVLNALGTKREDLVRRRHANGPL
jgi:propionyl-CoA carboxylase beta chain